MKLTRHRSLRRLHHKGKYYTYPEILAYIRAGNSIQVMCSKTKLEITNEVLRKCMVLKQNLAEDDLYALLRK